MGSKSLALRLEIASPEERSRQDAARKNVCHIQLSVAEGSISFRFLKMQSNTEPAKIAGRDTTARCVVEGRYGRSCLVLTTGPSGHRLIAHGVRPVHLDPKISSGAEAGSISPAAPQVVKPMAV
jgi:hypothetical protein